MTRRVSASLVSVIVGAVLLCTFPVSAGDPVSGSIGLWTWNTAVEFDYVKVVGADGSVLYEADFEDPADAEGWIPRSGTWEVADGLYRQVEVVPNCQAIFGAGDLGWSDYTLHVRARTVEGHEGIFPMFGVQPHPLFGFDMPSKSFTFVCGGWGNTLSAVKWLEPPDEVHWDWRQLCAEEGPVPNQTAVEPVDWIEVGRWYEIRVELEGRSFRCYLDDVLVHEIHIGDWLPEE